MGDKRESSWKCRKAGQALLSLPGHSGPPTAKGRTLHAPAWVQGRVELHGWLLPEGRSGLRSNHRAGPTHCCAYMPKLAPHGNQQEVTEWSVYVRRWGNKMLEILLSSSWPSPLLPPHHRAEVGAGSVAGSTQTERSEGWRHSLVLGGRCTRKPAVGGWVGE